MAEQQQRAKLFKGLHVKGEPVILYNIWDPGSALAVASQGAKAIATGSHGVANAFGYEDGEQMPLDLVIDNARRIVEAVGDELPVTMDIETGCGETPQAVKVSVGMILETGIVGVNIEDQLFGRTELRPVNQQVERLMAVRAAGHDSGVDVFINARCDLFRNAPPEEHDQALLDKALERAQAYADAGADGFFLPGIRDLDLITALCEQSPLPVNLIWLPGLPEPSLLAEAGASRISYGPGPYLQMIEWLKANAKEALSLQD